jgi:hypothetical protein
VVLVRVDYQKKNNKKLLKGLETIRVIYSGKVWRSSTHAVFHLNGQVNLHNCFYYAMENPHKTCVKLLKSPSICFLAKITFDYGLVHQVIDGTVTGEKYCDLLQRTIVPFIRRKRTLIYKQDGASAHFSHAARTLLNKNLQDRRIGRGGPRNWPSRSPDLSMNDFWL